MHLISLFTCSTLDGKIDGTDSRCNSRLGERSIQGTLVQYYIKNFVDFSPSFEASHRFVFLNHLANIDLRTHPLPMYDLINSNVSGSFG